jgi:hypothetical protein
MEVRSSNVRIVKEGRGGGRTGIQQRIEDSEVLRINEGHGGQAIE